MWKRTLLTGLVILLILFIAASGCLRWVREPGPVQTPVPHPVTTATTRIPTVQETPPVGLSQVKVASVYERISDGVAFGRSLDQVIGILRDSNTDLIFRGFFRWEPPPQSPGATMAGYPASYVSGKAAIGYTYSQLGDSLKQIKAGEPGTIFVGAVAAQRLNRIEFNDMTGESFPESRTWAMALDPSSFAPRYSKTDAQCLAAKFLGWIGASVKCPEGYDVSTAPAYFPDITNEEFQGLLVSWAEKQIDLGADGIWIDMLYAQASLVAQQTGNPGHPAARAAFEASSKVIDEIHRYGTTRYNRHVLVGTWWTFAELPYTPPDIDFVTVAVPSQQITGGLDEAYWNSMQGKISGKIGNKPILVFIDWSGSASAPMGVFSQSLSPAQQDTFLENADPFFTTRGMIFVYPVHGGTFPVTSPRLSYGKYNVYDSLAPEFDTFGTITNLAQEKVGR